MKVNEVPQDNTVEYYEGVKRACYAVDEKGRYVIVSSNGWEAEELVNGLAVKELAVNLEKTRTGRRKKPARLSHGTAADDTGYPGQDRRHCRVSRQAASAAGNFFQAEKSGIGTLCESSCNHDGRIKNRA